MKHSSPSLPPNRSKYTARASGIKRLLKSDLRRELPLKAMLPVTIMKENERKVVRRILRLDRTLGPRLPPEVEGSMAEERQFRKVMPDAWGPALAQHTSIPCH